MTKVTKYHPYWVVSTSLLLVKISRAMEFAVEYNLSANPLEVDQNNGCKVKQKRLSWVVGCQPKGNAVHLVVVLEG